MIFKVYTLILLSVIWSHSSKSVIIAKWSILLVLERLWWWTGEPQLIVLHGLTLWGKSENTKRREKEIVTVVGPICESGDILIKNILVDKDINEGDSVILTNTGAYGHVMASKYNNRKFPIELIVN